MIFVDSNIPMYLVGLDPQKKQDTAALVESVSGRELLVTSVEVYQEIIYRYCAIRRREAIQPAFDSLDEMVEEVLPVSRDDVVLAKDIVLGHERLDSRDAVHAAVMRRHRIETVLSFDRGFDILPWIKRIPS